MHLVQALRLTRLARLPELRSVALVPIRALSTTPKEKKVKATGKANAWTVFLQDELKKATGTGATHQERMRESAKRYKALDPAHIEGLRLKASDMNAKNGLLDEPPKKKAPMNAYTLFVKDEIPAVAKAFPEMTNTERFSEVARRYKALDSAALAALKERAHADKQAFAASAPPKSPKSPAKHNSWTLFCKKESERLGDDFRITRDTMQTLSKTYASLSDADKAALKSEAVSLNNERAGS